LVLGCRLSNPNITSCKITGNSAHSAGGAIYCYDSSPTITDCVISDNSSTDGDGGGIFGCMGPITNCIITGNSAEGDGGGFCEVSGPLINCVINDNTARSGGGVFSCWGPITNCIISNNRAEYTSGLLECSGPITNCTIAGNRAERGGGVVGYDGPITNCIIWDNSPHQLSGSPSITYSNIQGGWPGIGNIDAEPLLTLDGHLRAGSVCIDAGDPNDDFPDQLDIDGEPRVMGTYVDMGGDEFFDTDEDGLPDWWETKYFGSTTAADPNADPDMDSYTNLTEYEIYSSDPTVAAKIYYVDANQPDDTGDGLSWDTAKRTIQAAIDAADNSDKVIIAQGTYTGFGNFDLDPAGRAIVIQSIDPNDPNIVAGTIINTGHPTGFYFQNGETPKCILSGLTITNCSWKGAIYCKNSSPTIKNCNITENETAGISCYESSPTINNCIITDNWGGHPGGGISCYNSSPTVNNCTITENREAGIYCQQNSSATITNCTITDNDIAGIYCQENSTATITNCNISDNDFVGIYCELNSSPTIKNCTINKNRWGIHCDRWGNGTITNSTISENTSGGIRWWGNLKIDNSTITDNSSGYQGGGICCLGDSLNSLTIKSCTITGNSSYSHGGGIYSSVESLTINNCTITGNSAEGSGGGIHSEDSDPNIDNCTISENSAKDSGGGIFCNGDLTITNSNINNNSAYLVGGISCRDTTLTNCTITGNSAEFIGGLACGGPGSPTITNCIISGNFADKICGGVLCGTSEAKFSNCTITGNTAGEHSGGIHCGFSNLTINNCIFWGNEAPDGPQIYLEDNSNVGVSYTDVQGGQADVFVEPGGTLNWGLGNIDADPCFVEPGYWVYDPTLVIEPNSPNAVWVVGDYHLLPDSPCIDAASDADVYTDIEGNVRPFDFPGVDNNGELPEFDMGAFEAAAEEARLLILPRVINRKSRQSRVMAWLRLPQGITKDQVDRDAPLLLYPGGTKAIRQFVIGNRRRGSKQANIIALFNKAELMDAIPAGGRVELQIFGHLLQPGQYFCGYDTVRIITPGSRAQPRRGRK
jgi:parallel beta-helix repeat protein/predicted outer membrane repeat protein